LIVDCGVHR